MIALVLFWVLCSLYAYYLWRRNAADSGNEPPAYPGALPIIGHTHLLFVGRKKGGKRSRWKSDYLWKVISSLSDECTKMGGVISLTFGPRTLYVICDPDDALTVANTCVEKDSFYEWGKPYVGEGLVSAKSSIWRNHRKLLNPAFGHLVLDGFLGIFNQQARRLVTDLANEVGKGPFDHYMYTRHNALETICLTALGVDFSDHTLLNREYVLALDDILAVYAERFQNILLYDDWIYSWSPLKKKEDRVLAILHKMATEVLQKRKSEMEGNVVKPLTEKKLGSKFKPFLDHLLKHNAFSDQEIHSHVDTMIGAGHDTSAAVLMYTMLVIGSHEHAQERIFKELDEVFGDSERDVEKHDLCKLMYLEAVVKESMRVIPIVPVIGRTLDKNVKLKNCTLSAGRTCGIFLYGVNRHPIWGPDAQEFRPERWLEPDHPTAFATFSTGRRNCIGKAYALMSMKTTLAHVLRHYRVKGDWTKLRLKLDCLLKPANGHYITIERRK